MSRNNLAGKKKLKSHLEKMEKIFHISTLRGFLFIVRPLLVHNKAHEQTAG